METFFIWLPRILAVISLLLLIEVALDYYSGEADVMIGGNIGAVTTKDSFSHEKNPEEFNKAIGLQLVAPFILLFLAGMIRYISNKAYD